MALQRVFVLGDDSRAFLAVVRSLGRRGLEVHVCPFNHTSPALASRYIAAVHRLPPYDLDAAAWVKAMRDLMERHRFALVVPCDDRSILPLHRHAEAWEGTRIALPNEQAFTAFFDKLATRRLAQQAGVAIAAGEVLHERPAGVSAAEQAAALVARYGVPLALKPRHSFDLNQIASRRSVRILDSEARLSAELDGLDCPENYLIEAFFRGSGVGVSVLAAEGRVVQAFQHHRVFESDPTGGSTYRVSAPLDPHLLASVEALAAASGLHGVAMFEFRKNMATGQAILLEVNARFWGSLPLAIASGVDFPAQLYDLLVEGRTQSRIAYRVGRYARSLGNDAYRLARSLDEPGHSLPVRIWRVAGDLGAGLGRTVLGRERHDSYALDDPRPWFGEWRQIGAWLTAGAGRRLPLMRRARAARSRRRLRAQLAPLPGQRRRLLVLCFGNICRSPFAGALLAARLRHLRPDIDVASAGFVARENRRSPEVACEQAAGFGVDLTAHRSRFASDEELQAADTILVFEPSNVAELARRGIAAKGRIVLLGDFGPAPGDIEDPYGKPAETFHGTYARIARCVEALADSLRG